MKLLLLSSLIQSRELFAKYLNSNLVKLSIETNKKIINSILLDTIFQDYCIPKTSCLNALIVIKFLPQIFQHIGVLYYCLVSLFCRSGLDFYFIYLGCIQCLRVCLVSNIPNVFSSGQEHTCVTNFRCHQVRQPCHNRGVLLVIGIKQRVSSRWSDSQEMT